MNPACRRTNRALPHPGGGASARNAFDIAIGRKQTRHDHFTIGWNVEDVVARISQIINRKEDNETLIENLGLCTTSHFSIQLARRRAEAGNLAPYVRHINYRPFDKRFILYLREFVCEPKTKTMHHMLYPTNVAMAILRRNRKENGSGFFVSRGLTAKDMVSNLDDALIWPLYIYSDTLDLLSLGDGIIKPNANISLAIIKQVKEKFSLSWIDSGSGDLENTIGPQDIFYYIYSILYCPTYRLLYAEFLSLDFPRLPFTSNLDLFRSLVQRGNELVSIHLVEFALADETNMPTDWLRYTQMVQFTGNNRTVEKLPTPSEAWQDGKVAINRSSGFAGLPEAVWNFYIGSYQVCHKWLKDRQGHTLTDEDILHYCKIVTAIHETIRLMAEIDEVIEQHGGWPIQ